MMFPWSSGVSHAGFSNSSKNTEALGGELSSSASAKTSASLGSIHTGVPSASRVFVLARTRILRIA